MRYRALDDDGDYTFGRGGLNFLVDSPAAVAQAVLTRMRLLEGEWFLDVTEGLPLFTQIIGYDTAGTRDQAIRQRILSTQGVTGILQYSSSFNPITRSFAVSATIDTEFGVTTISL